MIKTEMMQQFEAETGKQSAIVKFMVGGQALEQKSYPKLGPYDYSMDYIAWLEAKADAYDRLISMNSVSKQEVVAITDSIVVALAGLTDFEGLPVSELNYLQVIRKLKEAKDD